MTHDQFVTDGSKFQKMSLARRPGSPKAETFCAASQKPPLHKLGERLARRLGKILQLQIGQPSLVFRKVGLFEQPLEPWRPERHLFFALQQFAQELLVGPTSVSGQLLRPLQVDTASFRQPEVPQ